MRKKRTKGATKRFKERLREISKWMEPEDYKMVAPDLHEEFIIEEMSRYELNQILNDERVP